MDILIAGFSCVDFSNLNGKKLELSDGGESGDTFRACIEYVAKYRPAICIFENVRSCPWDKIKAILANQMDELTERERSVFGVWEADDPAYAAQMAPVDTKEYAIPHTRQRGYMIAIDRRRLGNADSAVEDWLRILKALRKNASCPFESFLFDDDQARHDMISPRARHFSELDWSLCHARNQDYRSDQGLGFERPLTRWVEGGSCTSPDFWDLDWVRSNTERIWDALDICHLRNAMKGFDDCYKTYDTQHGPGYFNC